MKIKKGDNVIVLTGKDRGKTGEVLRALPKEDKVVVKGINIAKRHTKTRKMSGIVEMEMPLHVSNVALAGKKSDIRDQKSGKKEAPKKETKKAEDKSKES